MHGYDPKHLSSHGIFYAMGPSIRMGYNIKSFENIHIYPLICKILDIPSHPDIDGDINQVKEMLR